MTTIWNETAFTRIVPLLFDESGNETCAFLLSHDGQTIADLMPACSLHPAQNSYRIGREQWKRAHELARARGFLIIGTVHSHPNGPTGPSDRDLFLARHLHEGNLRAVWHPRSGTLTTYAQAGILEQCVIRRPLWLHIVAAILFY